jgi:hypothetical protein
VRCVGASLTLEFGWGPRLVHIVAREIKVGGARQNGDVWAGFAVCADYDAENFGIHFGRDALLDVRNRGYYRDAPDNHSSLKTTGRDLDNLLAQDLGHCFMLLVLPPLPILFSLLENRFNIGIEKSRSFEYLNWDTADGLHGGLLD